MDKPYLILMHVFLKEMPSWGGGEIIKELDHYLFIDVDLEDLPSFTKVMEPRLKKIVENTRARDARKERNKYENPIV